MQSTLQFPIFAALACSSTLLAQNSILPRPDMQLSTTNGVHNGGTAANNDAGFQMFDVASPKQDLPDRAGGLVATSRLMYAVYADNQAGSVVIRFVRSIDGGRSFSAPTTIYSCDTANGEDLEGNNGLDAAEELSLVCFGDEVYLLFLTNKDAIGQAPNAYQSLYAIGSSDQGITWSQPVQVSPGIGTTRGDVDAHRGVASSTGLHVVYEWDYYPAGTNENFAYARLMMAGSQLVTIVPSTDVTNYAVSGPDVNDPSIDAQDAVVHISWNDDSDPALGTGHHQTWSVTSFDAGITFSLPFSHTQFTAPLTWATSRASHAKVDGGYAYTFMEDSRVDQDDVWMDRGVLDHQTGTVNWNVHGVMCSDIPVGGPTATAQLDVDGFNVDVKDGVIAILYRDDRTGAANSNFGHMACDQRGGDDFIQGAASHFTITNVTIQNYDVCVNENVICAVYEHCAGSSNEEGGIALSHDRGLSFTAEKFTTRGTCSTPAGTVDIDDLRCAVSLNGDYEVMYVDERAGNANTVNNCFLTGGKLPFLRDLTATNGTIEVHRIDPREGGSGLAFPMISAAGTLPGHAVYGNSYGYFVGLNNDLWFTLMLQVAPQLFTGITPAGDATFSIPGGIPNLTSLLGFPIDVAAGTLSFGPRLFQSYTDPVRM